METFEDRLRRFLNNPPNEIFNTILNSISNFTLEQLRRATEAGLYDLTFLGAHAVMQTVAKQIYGQTGQPATQFYLKNFVDGNIENRKFSLISYDIHNFRNVIAHCWSSKSIHNWWFDVKMEQGWLKEDDGLHVNPCVFMECFGAGFKARGPIWTMPQSLDKLSALKRKYRYLEWWLELDRDDTIKDEISALKNCKDVDAAIAQEELIRAGILARFKLGGV